MWGSIAKIFSGIGKVASIAGPLVQAGAMIYAANKQAESRDRQTAQMRQANQAAKTSQRQIMAKTQAQAEAKKAELAKQTSILEGLLKDREAKAKKIQVTQQKERKRQKRSLVHTGPKTWFGAAPLIKSTAQNPFATTLGG